MSRRFALCSAAFAAAAVLACHPAAPRLPDPDALAADVTIRRDEFGIPHILARTEEAAAFGFGYAQAEDHAAEIGRRYLSARGEEARYFGESGLANDAGMAQFDNAIEARRALRTIPPLYRRIISAYAAGVNRYVARNRSTLPEWMPEVTAAEVLANTRASAVDALSGPTLPRLLRRKCGPSALTEPHAAEESWLDQPGSNAFALAGSRTTTGKPILLGNPHLSWSSLYWEAHVRVPGRIDFYGSTLVGIPVLRAGFNDRLGFVTTNNAPDLDDVFALVLDQQRPDHYFEGFYHLSRARSLREWLAAMRLNLVPTSNFTYADADGNILYLWNGRIPVRTPGRDYGPDASDDARAGADVLAAWDGTVSATSEGAVLFTRFWDRYAGKVPQPFAQPWDATDPVRTPKGLADPAAAVAQLEEAVRNVRSSYGTERIAWGEVSRFRFGSLDLAGEGAPGAYGCFRVMRFDETAEAGRRAAGNVDPDQPLAGFGDAWVPLVDFSGGVTGWSVLSYGQTTDLRSPHSRDQIGIFAARRLRRAWYSEAEIAAHTARSYRP